MRYFLWCFILVSCSVTFNEINAAQDITQHPNWKLLEHQTCGISVGAFTGDRITGGENAAMGAYPWITRIGYSSESPDKPINYRCGGSLINQFYVVTAAHCVSNLPDGFKVDRIRLGEHNTVTNPDCESGYCAEPVQDFQPNEIIAHEDYNKSLFKNDIAIIKLDKPVIYNEFVMPICMLEGELLTKNFVGENAEVAGWGIYDINDLKSSTILQTVKLPIVETEQCKKVFRSYADIDNRQMCVGGAVGKDSCGGDSGGPLMKVENVDDGISKYYFVGLVSFGAKHCGLTATPAVYSKISEYLVWILDNLSS